MNRKHWLLITGWVSLGISLSAYALIIIFALLSRIDWFMRERMFFDSLWPYVNKPLLFGVAAYALVSLIMIVCGLCGRRSAK